MQTNYLTAVVGNVSNDAQSSELNAVIDRIARFFRNADWDDCIIAKQFYFSKTMLDKKMVVDTEAQVFPIFYKELKMKGLIKISIEALRKRLDNMVMHLVLQKIVGGNPVIYAPHKHIILIERIRSEVKNKLHARTREMEDVY